MKNILKSIFALTLLVGVSCSDDDLRKHDVLAQKNAIENQADPILLSTIITNSTLFYQNLGWGDSRLPSAAQVMMKNYQGGDNIYSSFKAPSDDLNNAMNMLKYVQVAIDRANERGSNTHVGIFKTFKVLMFSFMTDFYGDVYYSQALQGREGILYPQYDKQSDLYVALLAELDEAATLISSGNESISPTYDLMFGGDKSQWTKFNNSLKLRLLVHASAKLPNAAAQIAATAAKPLLSEDADMNASIAYEGTTSRNSWVGGSNNWGGTTGNEFVRRRPCKTLVDMLATYSDPRTSVWFAPIEKPWTTNIALDGVSFQTNSNGYNYTSTWEYVDLAVPANNSPEIQTQIANGNILDVDKKYAGYEAGMLGDFKNGNGHYNTADGGAYGNFKVSPWSNLFGQNSNALLKAQIMNKDEVQFMLAEAVTQGWIGGSADTYYRKGITYSLKRWGVSDADITTYLAQPIITLPGNKAGDLEKIATQKWIGLFSVASEAYLELRRTNLPDIIGNNNNQFPIRFRYPASELGQNKPAYDAGVATLLPAEDSQYAKMWLLQ